ncbi:MAG: aspartate/tyrosine/aromatic aminotransferase [Gammaproteobacteria bacterium]|nr:aspartate/tyrosine/aromatic aminotransferase [Gammaproteobacteria bacterium]
MIFANLDKLPPDPILGVTAAFRADPSRDKIDLGVGVYRDEDGNTPVPAGVREAERTMLADQRTKTYIGPHGNLEFNERIVELALGPVASEVRERTATIQTVGGCGALRSGAELIHASSPGAVVHVSDPTWANHEPLLGTSGLSLARYPYYDPATRGVAFERMLDHFGRLPSGSVVLLHACCHNPTGADMDASQWRAVADVFDARGLVPFVDLAYQGFGDDLETDVVGLRLLATRVPQLLLAMSCSKNFGLYRERTGALAIVAQDANAAAAIATHEARTARRMYSMPPDHGAAIVARLLGNARLRADWESEVRAMVRRMKWLRALLADRLSARRPEVDFSWVTRHRGMFSLVGLERESIVALRSEHHVYVPPDGRINIAGISDGNVDRVADAIVAVLD